MHIPSSVIIDYLEAKFVPTSQSEKEFVMNSVFETDERGHMSVNKETGLWQCFKSGEKGGFISLVSFLEKISFQAAKVFIARKLLGSPELLFYQAKTCTPSTTAIKGKSNLAEFEKEFRKVQNPLLDPGMSLSGRLAWNFSVDRGLVGQDLMYSSEGKFGGRVIIPYRHAGNRDSSMFFMQGRALYRNPKVKYLNPSTEDTLQGYRASEVLLPYDESKSFVFVTEGPLDALSLKECGVNATAIGGSYMSAVQARKLVNKTLNISIPEPSLPDYKKLKSSTLVLAYDNDEAGKKGMSQSSTMLAQSGAERVMFCMPPKEYKDWNEFHVNALGTKRVREHIAKNIIKSRIELELISRLS